MWRARCRSWASRRRRCRQATQAATSSSGQTGRRPEAALLRLPAHPLAAADLPPAAVAHPEINCLAALQVDARALTRELLRLHFGLVLALNEACVLEVGARQLLLRITATNTLDAEAQEEAVAYHCYRGEVRGGRGRQCGEAGGEGALGGPSHVACTRNSS